MSAVNKVCECDSFGNNELRHEEDCIKIQVRKTYSESNMACKVEDGQVLPVANRERVIIWASKGGQRR